VLPLVTLKKWSSWKLIDLNPAEKGSNRGHGCHTCGISLIPLYLACFLSIVGVPYTVKFRYMQPFSLEDRLKKQKEEALQQAKV
jgi:hypothetical protein